MVRLLGSASNTMIPQGLQTESYEFMVLENIRILNELVRLSVRSCMYAFILQSTVHFYINVNRNLLLLEISDVIRSFEQYQCLKKISEMKYFQKNADIKI